MGTPNQWNSNVNPSNGGDNEWSSPDAPAWRAAPHAYPEPSMPQTVYPQAAESYPVNPVGMPVNYTPKNKLVAFLLCLFFGGFGVHDFYLGYPWRGVTKLILWGLISMSWFTIVGPLFFGFILGMWVILDMMLILLGIGKMGRDSNGVPTQFS